MKRSSWRLMLLRPCRLAQRAAIFFLLVALIAWLFDLLPGQATPPQRQLAGHEGWNLFQLDAFHSRNTGSTSCPAPVVDWSQFQEHQPGKSAALLAEDLQDPAVPWVLKGLKKRSYSVELWVQDGSRAEAESVLQHHDLQAGVQIVTASVHQFMINATKVFMFVYMPVDDLTPPAGRGQINWIVMPAAGASAAANTDATPQLEARRAAMQARQVPATAGGELTSQDVALSTYDYLLYRSISDLTQSLPALVPALERLQNADRLFPLIDSLTFPFVPNKNASEAAEAFQAKFDQMAHRSGLNKIFRFFISATLSAYKARLTPATQRARDQNLQSVHAGARYAAVIVEARPHFSFLYTVLNAAWYLPGWTMNVVHSRVNAGFVQRILKPHLHVRFHQLETDNLSIDDYNNLMKSKSFWESLDADYILLFQTDSLILRPGAEAFTKFDYIGAPWHLENERWSQPALRNALPGGVGNGGFSIRSSKAMTSICDEHSIHSPLKEQEDVFFAVHVQASETFKVADRESAYQFCLEVLCRDMPNRIPFAVHAAWYYQDFQTMMRLLDTSLYGLENCN